MIIIPALSSFKKVLDIQNREIKGAVFLQSKVENFNAALAEFAFSGLPFIDIVDWYMNGKGFQRGSYRIKKLFDLCGKGAIDMIICYSREDLLEYKYSVDNRKESLLNLSIPIYCMKDCTIMKDSEIISLSEYMF